MSIVDLKHNTISDYDMPSSRQNYVNHFYTVEVQLIYYTAYMYE